MRVSASRTNQRGLPVNVPDARLYGTVDGPSGAVRSAQIQLDIRHLRLQLRRHFSLVSVLTQPDNTLAICVVDPCFDGLPAVRREQLLLRAIPGERARGLVNGGLLLSPAEALTSKAYIAFKAAVRGRCGKAFREPRNSDS